jgi:hypothetical protein
MRTLACRLLWSALLIPACLSVSFADRWAQWGDVAAPTNALEPTPVGDSHLGLIESGKPLQLRFAVPDKLLLGYWISTGNIVGMSGKGTSYQLILRRDAPDGPVLYQGPVIANGDEWNATNRTPVDLTDKLTDADRARGWLDIYATGIVDGDGWTLYRHNAGRPIVSYAAVASPETQRRMAVLQVCAERSISILPAPQELDLATGEFPLTAQTRIVYPVGSPKLVVSAATELREMIRDRTGLDLPVQEAARYAEGAINLGVMGGDFWVEQPPADLVPDKPEGYFLITDVDGINILGRDAPGAFYGAMSLGQSVRKTASGPSAPYLTVRDWPACPHRIIQYDIARGQTVNVDFVKRMIRELARCKINELLFYMEDDFRFRKYPFLGREGTFTHEKAAELSAYSRLYNVRLIPQFESLGHAGAVLGHEELKSLREAGSTWVFCTCEPKVWEFLDDVFGELCEAFPDSEYMHVGADEFENAFGKCERCAQVVADKGIGGLYAEHMNRLNALCKKHGRQMMFWPSHSGPTPELSNMTLQYQDKLDKDTIPTEWIYHGPAQYPQIAQYQKAGFKDVFCCPAVVGYSRVYPDYRTTFRGISGFYRAGADAGCGGAYCTTWEFMHGALVDNSWYGLLYAAECSWLPQSTTRADFDRRAADLWWGITGDAGVQLAGLIADPLGAPDVPGNWRNLATLTDLIWVEPVRAMRQVGLRQPALAQTTAEMAAALQGQEARLAELGKGATRNELTLRAADLAVRMMRYGVTKLDVFKRGTDLYQAAAEALAATPAEGAARLDDIVGSLKRLQAQAEELAAGYAYFVQNCGAYKGDFDRLSRQAQDLAGLAEQIAQLREQAAAGTLKELPPGDRFGFLKGTYRKIGDWAPGQMSEKGVTLRYDITRLLKGPGTLQVEWQYTRGAHGCDLTGTRLLCNGAVVAQDTHRGWTGAGTRGNAYRLELKEYEADAKYEVEGDLASNGGTDSRGEVWLILP